MNVVERLSSNYQKMITLSKNNNFINNVNNKLSKKNNLIKMTIRKDIIKLLENEELTAKVIADKLNIKLNNTRSYLSILEKSKRIEIVNDKKPYKYKTVPTNLQLLKQLHSIMTDIMDFNGRPSEKQIEIIKKVEARIK